MLSEEQAIEKLKEIREDTIKANQCGLSNNDFKEEIEVYNTVLNLITKLQKENEDLLREKEENKFIIAMANNEMLGYNQGYSDGKNQNSNATEIVIKNRQAYIHKEEVERYKRKIDLLQKELNEENKRCMVLANNDKFKEQVIELMAELVYKRFKAELLLEYGFENEEQLKQYFAELVEKE